MSRFEALLRICADLARQDLGPRASTAEVRFHTLVLYLFSTGLCSDLSQARH